MEISRNNKNRLYVGLLSILMQACTYSHTIRDFHNIPSEGWYKRSVESFVIPVQDTLSQYNVTMDIRHNTHFRYQDLWLYVSYSTPLSDSVLCDTVKIPITNESGQWQGKGWGSLYQVSVPLKNPLIVQRGDSAFLSVRPAMKDDYLKGVTEIGVTLKKQF